MLKAYDIKSGRPKPGGWIVWVRSGPSASGRAHTPTLGACGERASVLECVWPSTALAYSQLQPELRSWGAHPPSGVAGRAARPASLRADAAKTFGTFSCVRGFPRGRGKPHAGRVRSPSHFEVRVQTNTPKTVATTPGAFCPFFLFPSKIRPFKVIQGYSRLNFFCPTEDVSACPGGTGTPREGTRPTGASAIGWKPARKWWPSARTSDPVRPSQTFEIFKIARHGKNDPAAQAAQVDRQTPNSCAFKLQVHS